MKASIDIGTNTVLLLVAEVSGNMLTVIEEDHRAPRLGRGVDESGYLSEEAMQRVIGVLRDYQRRVTASYPEIKTIRTMGTSAVRDARNRAEFSRKIATETGLKLEILSGEQEARYTYLGAQSVLSTEVLSDTNVVIDIGGGSTEIALGTSHKLLEQYSFDMGCVRFTERYLKDDPLSDFQMEECQKAVRQMLSEYPFSFRDSAALIGVAGSVTSLAYMAQDMDEYIAESINSYIISLETLREYIFRLKTMTARELIRKYPIVMEERADIFRAGLLILEGFMDRYGFSELVASTGGIRHGSLLADSSDQKGEGQ